MPLSTADGKERAVKEVIMKVPSFSADYPKAPIYVAELVRCKECVFRNQKYLCQVIETDDDDFCSYGVKKGADDE